MRKIILLSASVVALFSASPAFADADLVITGLMGGDWLNGDGSEASDASGYALLGGASVEYDFTPVIGAQGDLVVNFGSVQFDDMPVHLERTSLDGALHLFYRDESFLLGGFVQLGTTTMSFDEMSSGFPDMSRGYIGAEGQVYIDNLTLYGQVGLVQHDFSNYAGSDALNGAFASIEARYFLTPNFKIAASAGIQQLGMPDDAPYDNFTTVTVGASAEYKFDDLPVSIFGRIDYADQSISDYDYSLNETRAMVGIKFAMGEETLYDRDRSGVTLKPVEFGQYGFPFPFYASMD